MTTSMRPPPPPTNPKTTTNNSDAIPEGASPSVSILMKTPVGPPPPINPNPPEADSVQPQTNADRDEPQPNHPPQRDFPATETAAKGSSSTTTTQSSAHDGKQELHPNVAVPYSIPSWSGAPSHHYFLEVLKDGSIIDQFDVTEKGAYMFGRVDLCDFVLEHPTISRFHAVLQFKSSGDAYIYDLGSMHGTFVNKNLVKKKVYVELHVGDVIRFGRSSRLYIFQGPSELMPAERDLKSIRNAKIRDEMQDMEASLLRAKLEASLADGISWGICEDAIEEIENDIEEITWQTFKGQLTEKQEKTRDKVMKRLEKIANMKKETDAIRAKDISQGGLTQGQQTQIARNEQRTSQLMEELENLEETLNESIRESLGARAGTVSHGKKKGETGDDEEEYLSDDDDFYDRTKKKPSRQKVGENQPIETADSLLDKKDSIIKEMKDKRKLLLEEKERNLAENVCVGETGDALDAYMSGLSSQLVLDKTEQLEKELSELQSELDRVLYLLKIADPTGEAARKRESKAQEPRPSISKIAASVAVKKHPSEQNKGCGAEETVSGPIQKLGTADAKMELGLKPEEAESVADATLSKTTVCTVAKPQWLGAAGDVETKEAQPETPLNTQEGDQFVDYKDRKKVLGKSNSAQMNVASEIENAAPGLIIRKRKQVEDTDGSEAKSSEGSLHSEAKTRAEDAVALLLKHTRGYHASDDDEVRYDNEDVPHRNLSRVKSKKTKLLGPERPSFLDNDTDYESWVPPEGQSGDGRTSLNDRLGY